MCRESQRHSAVANLFVVSHLTGGDPRKAFEFMAKVFGIGRKDSHDALLAAGEDFTSAAYLYGVDKGDVVGWAFPECTARPRRPILPDFPDDRTINGWGYSG